MNKLFTEIGIALSLFMAISISFNSTSAININAVAQTTTNQITAQQEAEKNIIQITVYM